MSTLGGIISKILDNINERHTIIILDKEGRGKIVYERNGLRGKEVLKIIRTVEEGIKVSISVEEIIARVFNINPNENYFIRILDKRGKPIYGRVLTGKEAGELIWTIEEILFKSC